MKLETVTGRLIDIANPDPDVIEIEDIAWGLSRLNRFAGHTITAIPPTVAQHSIFVSDLIYAAHKDEDLALIGLMHDAAESFLGDIPSPVKHIDAIAQVVREVEDNLLSVIFDKFLGRQPTENEKKICHQFDKQAQFVEAYHFMHSRGLKWPGREEYNITLRDLHDYPEILTSIQSYEKFLARFQQFHMQTFIPHKDNK